MFLARQLSLFARPAAFALALALVAGSAQAAAVDYFLKIEGVDGESTSMEAAGLDLQSPGGGEPVLIGLLLPAVQKVREAASRPRFAELACDGSVLPRVTVDVSQGGGRAFMRYELTNARIVSFGMHGSSDGLPMESLSLNFERATWTYLESGESFSIDCSSGRCACTP